jgi:hypothetical protein
MSYGSSFITLSVDVHISQDCLLKIIFSIELSCLHLLKHHKYDTLLLTSQLSSIYLYVYPYKNTVEDLW